MNRLMKTLPWIFILICPAACKNETAYVEREDDAATVIDDSDILLEQRPNSKYDLTAFFYGSNTVYKDRTIKPVRNIQFIIFKENKSGNRILYHVDERKTQAYGFYFTEIWSPDGEHVVLPLGKQDGFVILESKSLIQDLSTKTYVDSIRVWQDPARKHWHNFGKWQDNNTLRFSVEGEQKGEAFPFSYNFKSGLLTCGWSDCSKDQSGDNRKGHFKPVEAMP